MIVPLLFKHNDLEIFFQAYKGTNIGKPRFEYLDSEQSSEIMVSSLFDKNVQLYYCDLWMLCLLQLCMLPKQIHVVCGFDS